MVLLTRRKFRSFSIFYDAACAWNEMFTFISNNGLYDDGKKMTKNDSVDHISENDRTHVIMGWLVATLMWPILNQKGTENIANFYFSHYSLLKDFDILTNFDDF